MKVVGLKLVKEFIRQHLRKTMHEVTHTIMIGGKPVMMCFPWTGDRKCAVRAVYWYNLVD